MLKKLGLVGDGREPYARHLPRPRAVSQFHSRRHVKPEPLPPEGLRPESIRPPRLLKYPLAPPLRTLILSAFCVTSSRFAKPHRNLHKALSQIESCPRYFNQKKGLAAMRVLFFIHFIFDDNFS